MDNELKIERAANGYTIHCRDPKIAAANRKRDITAKNPAPWRDPNREYVFKTADEVLAWLKLHMDKALPADDYSSAFDLAVADTDDDGE